jgi:hypothetical protein
MYVLLLCNFFFFVVFAPLPALRNDENLPTIDKTKHRPKRGRKRYKMKGPKSWQKQTKPPTGTYHKRNYEQIQYSNSFNGKEHIK